MNYDIPKLTRYLYFKDEVCLSLINALLRNKELNECLFWTSELYYSGYYTETWHILWKIYYDFYAIKSPKLEKFIINIYKKWRENQDISYILSVVKNFHSNATASPEVFCMRSLIKIQKKKVAPLNRQHLPRDFKYNIKYRNLLYAIHRKDYNNLAFYIQKYHNMEGDIYCAIISYFKDVHGIPFKNIEMAKKRLESHPYKDKIHIIISLIFHCYTPGKEIIQRNIIIRASADNIIFIKDLNTITIKPLYKTLQFKRLYGISDKIGCFQLDRYNPKYPEANKLFWYHWEYFAYHSPLWRKRFEKYSIEINHKTWEITFNNVDEEEEFHEIYNYEPDEQSKEIQEKSIATYPELTIGKWLKEIFCDNTIEEQLSSLTLNESIIGLVSDALHGY